MDDPALKDSRIGAVSYLNTKPLIHALETDSLILDVPAKLARDFYAGKLDVALLPLFAVLQAGGGRLVDDVAIACRGEVYSVFVASHGTFADCPEIHLDPSSRSSSALLRVLLAEYYPGSHRIVEEGAVPAEAARLLIGDPAIRFRQQHGAAWSYHDLGALWHKHTGLPFVFAVWAVSEKAGGIGEALRAAKVSGLAARAVIAARESDPDFARRYLGENIRFDIGPEEKQAIGLFETLARRHGMLPAGEPAKITWC